MNLIIFIAIALGIWIILDSLDHIDRKLDELLKEKDKKK